MTSENEEQQIKLEDISLSEMMVKAGGFPESQLFELVVNTRYLGIYWWQDLKDYFSIAPEYIDRNDVKLSYYQQNDWHSYRNHPVHSESPQNEEPNLEDEIQSNEVESSINEDEEEFLLEELNNIHDDIDEINNELIEESIAAGEEVHDEEALQEQEVDEVLEEEQQIAQQPEPKDEQAPEEITEITEVNEERRKVVDEVLDEEYNYATSEQLFVLKDGLKLGPYNVDDIKELLANRQLFYTDKISHDRGHHWQKIALVSIFDRRSHSEENLPASPNSKVMKTSKKEIAKKLHEQQDHEEEKTEALINLAHISHKSAKSEQTKTFIMPNKLVPTRKVPWNLVAGLVLLIAVGVTAQNFLIPKMKAAKAKQKAKETMNDKTKATAQKLPAKKAKVIKPVQAKRLPASSSSRPTPRTYTKPKPLSNNPVINQRPPEEPQEPMAKEDDYYYDDATDPVELDPVQEEPPIQQAEEDNYDDYEEEDKSAELDRENERDLASEAAADYAEDYPPEEDY